MSVRKSFIWLLVVIILSVFPVYLGLILTKGKETHLLEAIYVSFYVSPFVGIISLIIQGILVFFKTSKQVIFFGKVFSVVICWIVIFYVLFFDRIN